MRGAPCGSPFLAAAGGGAAAPRRLLLPRASGPAATSLKVRIRCRYLSLPLTAALSPPPPCRPLRRGATSFRRCWSWTKASE